MNRLTQDVQAFKVKYFEKLKTINDVNKITDLKNDMLSEIKQLLTSYKHLDTYDGYQIVAELWETMLAEDTEKIANSDFYTIGRTKEENWVTKGSGQNRRTEQDGWIGSIVPNELILSELYQDEQNDVETKKEQLTSIEEEINELVEAAKVEESVEESALSDCFNAREDDFTVTAVRSEISKVEEGTEEYDILLKVRDLLTEKSALNRAIREKEKELNEKVEDRIEQLTDDEIDQLMYEKWFGSLSEQMTKLIETSLKNELDELRMLQERYADTLEAIDEESKALEAEFEAMLNELVVTEE